MQLIDIKKTLLHSSIVIILLVFYLVDNDSRRSSPFIYYNESLRHDLRAPSFETIIPPAQIKDKSETPQNPYKILWSGSNIFMVSFSFLFSQININPPSSLNHNPFLLPNFTTMTTLSPDFPPYLPWVTTHHTVYYYLLHTKLISICPNDKVFLQFRTSEFRSSPVHILHWTWTCLLAINCEWLERI